MLLQATLLANLDALKVYIPNIYDTFKDYSPESSGVVFDEQGHINLANNGEYVYSTEAKKFSQQQVKLFVENPTMFTFNLGHQEDKDICFEHARLLKEIRTKREAEAGNNNKPIEEPQLDMLCMVGSGLGYQIEALFEQKKIINFLLCEPSKDIFYAMLHCIELKPIIESCQALGGRFSVRIGGSASGMINSVSEMLHQQGHFNLSRLFFYRHYISDTSDELLQLFKDIGYRWSSGWGFMEDEIIGITHTLSNIQAGFEICKNKEIFENKISTKPVFIAGNGPSLDESIEYLKKNQDRLIIVSAGTSLKALLKNDIKPDIHFEMERTLRTMPYLEVIEKQQKNSNIQLSDIQVIALNTVATQVLNKFKTPLLLTKRFDGGGQLIQKADKLERHVAPEYCNPTVSNTALVTLLSLGFKNIYLAGTDFGYLCESHHHSKDSIYYDEDYFAKERVERGINKDKKVKGNFTDFVYTTDIFDSSRGNVELALQEQVEKYNQLDTKVYNCSNGAFIRFTEPKSVSDLPVFKSFTDKVECLDVLLTEAFENKQFTRKKLDKSISNSFAEVKLILDQLMKFTNKEMQSREELSQAFHLQNALLMKLKSRKEYQVTYWIIQGTFRYFQAYIMTNTYYYDDLNERNKFINYCLSAFRKHIKQRYSELLHAYNKPSKA
ncbi:hypothetical protein CXF85_20405 [Colwellia sp. 75C3]|nr:hypothetical protein CXF85_20405 [Colwellia sp. 75C3]